MIELSPKAAALVRAGRSATRPSVAARERTAAALRARLGPAALPLDYGLPGSSFASSAWAKLAAFGAAIGIAGGSLFLAVHEPPATAVPVPPPQALGVQGAEARHELPVRPEPEPPSVSAHAGVSVASALRPADRLAEEVAILARATSELHAGRAASALKAIEEHQRKFPRGLLAQERRAARVQALCSLGRRREAQSELERLAKNAPKSPNTVRAQQICDTARSR